ncbi:pogo transposable element with KRAB domain [Ixodes scapularis]
MGKHLNSYSAGVKLKVEAYALDHGKRAAGRQFEVDEKCVRCWCDQKDALASTSKTRRAFRGKPCKMKALALARAKNIPSDFKASAGWIRRFMKREDLLIRRRTTMCQRLPAEYEDKLLSFQKSVSKLRREHGYILSQIGNADHTPVWFDSPENCTVNAKGQKSVLSLLKKKGWMNDELVVDWLKNVWKNRPGGMLLKKSLLVMDSFRGHLTPKVRAELHEAHTHLAVIPGGLTGMLQPLDVSVNRHFKVEFRRCYTDWMASGNHEKTPTGRLKRTLLGTVAKCILDA